MNEIEANSIRLTKENADLRDKFYKLSIETVSKDTFQILKNEVENFLKESTKINDDY